MVVQTNRYLLGWTRSSLLVGLVIALMLPCGAWSQGRTKKRSRRTPGRVQSSRPTMERKAGLDLEAPPKPTPVDYGQGEEVTAQHVECLN